MDRSNLPPVELWLFIVGFAVYTIVPLLPGISFTPANPAGLFAAGMALLLVRERRKRIYWGTTAMAWFAVVYPVLVLRGWLTVASPGWPAILWVFATPAFLVCLLRTQRLRHFANVGPPAAEGAV